MEGAVYLDYNATTPLKPEAKAAMSEAFEVFGNPSSIHGPGRAARALTEQTRALLAARLEVKPAQIVFTSGGTEANAAALSGLSTKAPLVSSTGHDSLRAFPGSIFVPSTNQCVVDLPALDALLAKAPAPTLVAVMLVNNETGVIQPMAELAAIVARHGALLHVDAVQALGKLPFTFTQTGAHSLSVSAHKIGGPKGVGALILREGMPFVPLIAGGGQERRRRAGTENLIGISGFGGALKVLDKDIAASADLAKARDSMESAILAVAKDVVIPGRTAPRVGGTSCIVMPNVSAETQLIHFDLAGIAVSSGAACSSGKLHPSHVLLAMQYDQADARSALRISGGLGTLPADYDRAGRCWLDLWRRKRQG